VSEPTFLHLAGVPCSAPADPLIGPAADLGPVAAGELHARLDDHARRLFGLARHDAAGQPQRLADVMERELGLPPAAGWDCLALLLDCVLASGRGHPAVRAAIGADLCRRAGVAAGCSPPRNGGSSGSGTASGLCCSMRPYRPRALARQLGSAAAAATSWHSAC
jgi:hypothetical protein